MNFLLHALWWLLSPWYRRLGTPKRAEKYISRIAAEGNVSRAQAVAMIWAKVPEPLRPVLDQYRVTGS